MNMWDIDHGPRSFISDEECLSKVQKTSKILRITHIYSDGPIIDAGWYGESYKTKIYVEGTEQKQLGEYESKSHSSIYRQVIEWMNQYSHGTNC